MSITPQWRLDAPSGLSLAQAQRLVTAAPPRTGRSPDSLSQIIRPEATQRWRGSTVGMMTPDRVDWVLRGALAGDMRTQWELFDLMEETWPRLAKNLLEIKRAVASMTWTVEPWAEDNESPSESAEERAGLVSHCLWKMRPDQAADERNFNGLIHDILDAWGKGISVNELIWEERDTREHGRIFGIRGTTWVHPDFYAIGRDGLLGLRTGVSPAPGVTASGPVVEPFPPYKFIVTISKARTTHFCGAALLRPLAWWWASANFSAQWLLNYAQLFGVPIRWANYPEGAADEVISKVNEHLANMGSSAWASFPEGTTLQLHEGNKTHSSSPQEGILDRADKQCDLLILGQTLTSDASDRGTQALGTVHERIRGDVLSAATDWVGMVLTEQLVPAILELNYGDTEESPEIRGYPIRVEDKLANAQRDAVLLGQGVVMPKEWFYERHDIPLPKEGEEVIGKPPGQPDRPPGFPPGFPPRFQSPFRPDDPDEPEPPTAAMRVYDPTGVARVEMDEIVRRALAESIGARRQWLAPLRAEIERVSRVLLDPAKSDEAVLKLVKAASERLPELLPEMDVELVAENLRDALGAAALAGAELALDNRPLTARRISRSAPIMAFNPNQHRDEDGKWAQTGKIASKYGLARAEFVGGKLKMADGSEPPEHIAKLKLPPAWSQVQVSPDAKSDLQAVGLDKKGRTQRVYSDEANMRKAEEKFARNKELLEKQKNVFAENARNMESDDAKVREPAVVMGLIQSTGLRPGSDRDTGAEKKAYGATTLEGRHVFVDGQDVRLRFTGKKGVDLDIAVEDRKIATMLMQRKQMAGEEGRLFGTNADNLRKYSKTLGEGKFKPKDFRTLLGTKTALDMIGDNPARATSDKEYKKRVHQIAARVSKRLGNTPKIALQSYINPIVFDDIKPL